MFLKLDILVGLMAEDNKVPLESRGISDEDWQLMAAAIIEDLQGRKTRRANLEKQWDEVDRQVAMKFKAHLAANGKPIPGTEWLPQVELPWQALALEMLTADARRLLFPDDRTWFSAHVNLTDKFLEKVDFKGLISGDENDVPSLVNQENADALIEGVLSHHHGLYDFRGVMDRWNAEAFKYGTSVAQARMVRLSPYTNEYRGVEGERRIPVLVPLSIRSTYLDDSVTQAMHEGIMLAPHTIRERWQSLNDLRIAATKGSREPTSENGGWMPDRLIGIEPTHKDKESVRVIEQEGDLILPQMNGPSIYLPNVIVSVVVGSGEPTVFRYREKEFPFRSYISHPYHVENASSPYGVSPLMKGRPIQVASTQTLGDFLQAAALNARPPVAWNPTDPYLQASGGPKIEPAALWESITKPEPIKIGDVPALLQAFLALKSMYDDMVGLSAPRLGGQTKSHQTAFAVDTEQSRGVTRTVDYIRSLMFGPLPTWLAMEFHMLKKTMPEQDIYLPKYQGYVRLSKAQLPETVTFDVHGAAGPAEEREKEQRREKAIQQALAIEIQKLQMMAQGLMPPDTPRLNIVKIQEAIMREGFTDVDQFFAGASEGVPGATGNGAGVPGAPEGVPEDQLAQLLASQGA